MPTFKKPLLIQNPTAGKSWSGRLNKRLMTQLQDWLPSLSVKKTERSGHATELARQAAKEGSELVIATGGDGTVNEIINGIVGTGTVLAYLPTGTGNTMARELGLTADTMKTVEALKKGEVREIYIGMADERYFALMVGIGFDGEAVRRVPYWLKRLLGRGSYLWAGGMTLVRYSYPAFSVTANGRTFKATSIVVSKSRYYASRFQIAPDMSWDIPTLKICAFPGQGIANYLRYVGSVLLNRHSRLSDVVLETTREVNIEGAPELPAQMDGEPLKDLPKVIRIAKERISLLYPR